MKKAFIFPGQGSQSIGMGKDLYKYTEIGKKLYNHADTILGYSISNISFDGPYNKLKKTQYTQPAIFIHSVIISKILETKNIIPDSVAGHSLGELSALVCANVITFDEGLKIVKTRCEEMSKAGEKKPGAMAAIIGASKNQLKMICGSADSLVPSNFNAPNQTVISGVNDEIDIAIKEAKKIGVKIIKLNVSGAFHSHLMSSAKPNFKKILDIIDFKNSKIGIYQNFTSKLEFEGKKIKENLLNQLENPVNWINIISNMINDNIKTFIEIGNGKILQRLNKRINKDSVNFGISNLDEINNYDR